MAKSFWYLLALLSLLSLIGQQLSRSSVYAAADFEGFGDESEEEDEDQSESDLITNFRSTSPPPLLTQSDFKNDVEQQKDDESKPDSSLNSPSIDSSKPSSTVSFEYWDEDEFEGLPVQEREQQEKEEKKENPNSDVAESISESGSSDSKTDESKERVPFSFSPRNFIVEIICVSFLIMFAVNYFTGKKENENIALSWASRFATKDSIFDKNFSLLGTGDGKDTPLLLKEGQNVFKFYASGRRYCQGLLATMELKSRHDLISRLYNMVVPCKDEITFEVYMNDDSMDHVMFALAKKKAAKLMHKEFMDLQRYASFVPTTPTNRKWVAEELGVVTESREVAGDLITEAVLDQVFGDKAFEKFGKGFISMHFSDQHQSSHRKMLVFKFALPDAKNMADMTRLVALVPYYIDLIGRYKLSSQARSKTEAARNKAAQEVYKELRSARQEALQKKKAEKRKMMEELEAKLSAEAIKKKEAKERARQMKKVMPKVKMSRS
ncbi:hypothetical protein C5167_012994 [Papaver somniferum]|uniref:DUF1682 domain-containing protein n=1 Tax=Papaver somniferum TaxID=3469 RepID=A0A4Y7J264_PAPSO|nr:uncharacterized protein At5g49945-like [Papaver somniferum]RZC54132.1 hypothetical protein C5167_012994 [Papaver somniferum]